MVVIFYNLAAKILGQDLLLDVESQINPSVLYEYLTTRGKDNFEETKLCFNTEAYSQDLKAAEKVVTEETNKTNSTQEFKETFNQIKNNNNNNNNDNSEQEHGASPPPN
jgi:hypothetical protein